MNKAKTLFYFGYGSNMSTQYLIKRRKIIPASSSVGLLKDYQLIMNMGGPNFLEPSFANIRELEGSNVEGVVHEIYLDHLGYPTFGIGHLVTDDDPEYGADVGTEVDEARCIEAFDKDVETVLSDCKTLYPDFDSLPEEVQQIIANMMFNMGRPRLTKFKMMKAAVDEGKWNDAADQMIDSRWYAQVGARAERLVDRMRNVG